MAGRIDWRGISGLRNRIVHEYFGVDSEIVWEIVLNDVPTLRDELTLLASRLA